MSTPVLRRTESHACLPVPEAVDPDHWDVQRGAHPTDSLHQRRPEIPPESAPVLDVDYHRLIRRLRRLDVLGSLRVIDGT